MGRLRGSRVWVFINRSTDNTFSSPRNTAPSGAVYTPRLDGLETTELTPTSRLMFLKDWLDNILSLMAVYVKQSDWMPQGATREILTCIFVPSQDHSSEIKSCRRRKSCKC